jgi:hypothetical protein
MIDRPEVLTAALADFGEPAAINGGSLTVLYSPAGSMRWTGQEEVLVQQPTAEALTAEVEALDIVAGPRGDLLTISGLDYTVLAIDPDGEGGSLMTLQRRYLD